MEISSYLKRLMFGIQIAGSVTVSALRPAALFQSICIAASLHHLRRFTLTRQLMGKFSILATVVLSLFVAATLHAQDNAASLTGTVTDASGAVVPGAKIVLINKATNQSYQAESNSGGSYTISNIVPGPGYTETVSRDGFETTVLTGLYLNIGVTR